MKNFFTSKEPYKLALSAVIFEFVLGYGVFLIFILMVCSYEHVSLAQAVFGPLPGNPLIYWVYTISTIIFFQGLSVVLLKSKKSLSKTIGGVVCSLLLLFFLVWLIAVFFDQVQYFTNRKRYMEVGAFNELFGVIPALVICFFNYKAALQNFSKK